SATLVNDFYVAKVKHSTFWNCDYKAPLVECKFKVKDKNNKPIIGAKVFTKLINSTLYGTGYTDSKGQIIGLIPKDELLNLTVTLPYSQCQNPSYDKVIGPFSQNDSLDIVIDDPGLYYYTIKGNLLNCDFKPITNGYLMITGFSDLILTDDQGNFETTLITCGPQLNAQVNIKGFDTDNFKASQEYVLNVISGNTTNAGIIQVCTAISDYISYSFNGDTYIYTDPKITGNTNNWLLINRKHLNNSIGINIEIINFNGLGNSTIDQIDATGEAKNGVYIVHGCEYGKSFCNDLTANITEFNGPGGYVSGTYSGMVADSTINPVTPIMITGTFRSKWNK
ncbi:MAG TPA: hypothetical protein VK590_07400, partial [Saprospiraceae bacterium]|nr:hypothetical protein [Saprospiraceae bacterium]